MCNRNATFRVYLVHPEVRIRGETFRMYLLYLGSMRIEVAELWRGVKMVSVRTKKKDATVRRGVVWRRKRVRRRCGDVHDALSAVGREDYNDADFRASRFTFLVIVIIKGLSAVTGVCLVCLYLLEYQCVQLRV